MADLEIFPVPYLADNFSYIIRRPSSGATILVDCGDAEPVMEFLQEKNWQLDAILLTHFHHDHTGDTEIMLENFPEAQLSIPFGEKRLPWPGQPRKDSEKWSIKGLEIMAVDVSAHTLPSFSYLIEDNLFTGDALFSAGCGRLFEGTADDLAKAMDRISSFPVDTKLYFAHEYTLANLKFAQSVEPENRRIREYIEECQDKRKRGEFTTPSTLAQELEINPFLRIDQPSVIQYTDPEKKLGRTERMRILRKSKDNF